MQMGLGYLAALFPVISIVAAVLIYLSRSVRREFRIEVYKQIHRDKVSKSGIVKEYNIKDLPVLIQKYLRYVGVVGKEKVRSLRSISEIDMNLGNDRGWSRMIAEEYNFFNDDPTRLVFLKFKIKGLPIHGMDSYLDGKGRMLIKPLGLFTVNEAKGNIVDDTSAAVMLLLNMCAGAPATLIDSRIQWTQIGPLTIKATLNDSRCIVSGVLEFNEKGELVNFSTEDKYYSPSGDTYEKVSWSTALKDYKQINGLMLSTYGEAIWNFSKGDFIYGKLTLKEMEYNLKA